MTPEQSRSVETIVNMILKFLFGVVALGGWVIVLNRWLDAKTQFDLWKFGSMETFLTITIGFVFRHYFGYIRKK